MTKTTSRLTSSRDRRCSYSCSDDDNYCSKCYSAISRKAGRRRCSSADDDSSSSMVVPNYNDHDCCCNSSSSNSSRYQADVEHDLNNGNRPSSTLFRDYSAIGIPCAAAAEEETSRVDAAGRVLPHTLPPTCSSRRKRRVLRASICLKLTVFVGFLVVLASGIPALVLWLKAHEQLVGEIEHRLLIVSTLRQEQLKEYLDSESEKAGLIASRVLINSYLTNKPGSNRSLAQYDLISAVSVIADFLIAAVYDAQGRLLFTAGPPEAAAEVLPAIDIAAITPSHRLTVGYPRRSHRRSGSSNNSEWVYNITQGIFDASNPQKTRLVGVFLTWANATRLETLVYDRTGLQKTGELLVGTRVQHQTEKNEIGDDIEVHLLFPALQDRNSVIGISSVVRRDDAMAHAIAGESGVIRQRDARSGADVVAAYRPVGFMDWGLVAKIDIREAYAPVQSVRFVILTTISILVFVGVMASLGLAKIFTDPIIELGKAAASLGEGNMTTRVRKGTILLRDEIADLMDTFNSMAHEISSHQSILEQKVRERTLDLGRANEGLAQEIEERRRIEAELEEAKDVAITANRYKSEFLANMSHEIRTPLNAIINFTELCLDTPCITPDQREHLDYVRFAAQHLLRLITDILDFSKIEAGKLEMEEVDFSLRDQLEHALSVLAARALQNGLELCCDIDPDVPDRMVGDPGRLLQILVNLIGNGIKFTDKGEVVVHASVRSTSPAAVELLFSVQDTGMGIPDDKQSLLFRAFSQVDSSTQRIYGGTGLGLVISSKLAAAMGGHMWVESSGLQGQGSTFFFTATFAISPEGGGEADLAAVTRPAAAADHDVTTTNPPPPHQYNSTCSCACFKGAKALVVDDNETSCRVLGRLLQSFGMIAECATSVEAAEASFLQQQQNNNNNSKYNVVLLDMHLQGTDAEELVRFLLRQPHHVVKFSAALAPAASYRYCRRGEQQQKSGAIIYNGQTILEQTEEEEEKSSMCTDVGAGIVREDSGSPLPLAAVDVDILGCIIMLTSVNHTDANKCEELGVRFHTSKPIKRSMLLRTLHSALGVDGEPSKPMKKRLSEEAADDVFMSRKSLHVLVAEDNVVNQKVVSILLQKWGHTFVMAKNGEEAVDEATKQHFDIILMDVQMPICDGFQATAKIREMETPSKHTPIVAMTAHAMAGDGDRCIAAGMDLYISKPLNAKKLQELIQNVAAGSVVSEPRVHLSAYHD